MKNFPTIADMTRGYNYVLKEGRPYSTVTIDKNFNLNFKGWNNGDRVVAASRVLNGEDIKKVANEVNCCTQSIRNWIKTLDKNNPRLEG